MQTAYSVRRRLADELRIAQDTIAKQAAQLDNVHRILAAPDSEFCDTHDKRAIQIVHHATHCARCDRLRLVVFGESLPPALNV